MYIIAFTYNFLLNTMFDVHNIQCTLMRYDITMMLLMHALQCQRHINLQNYKSMELYSSIISISRFS